MSVVVKVNIDEKKLNKIIKGKNVTISKILGTVLKHLKNIGMKAGEAFKVNNKVSLNPFELGYDLGHDVIAPALMKNGINFVPKSQRG